MKSQTQGDLTISVETPNQQAAGRMLERLRWAALFGVVLQTCGALAEIPAHLGEPFMLVFHLFSTVAMAATLLLLAVGLRWALELLALPFTVNAQVAVVHPVEVA